MISSGVDSSPAYTDSRSLDKLKFESRNDPEKALESVARQFEALFTQTLLKSMRDTSSGDGLLDNDQTRLYQDLFDKQISTNLSEKRGIGLADVLIRQLRQIGTEKIDPTSNEIPEIKKFNVSSSVSVNNDNNFKSPQDYLKEMYPIANQIENDHGIPAAVMLAQSALETGWGRHVMQANDDKSSNNLFGIKADSRWDGPISTKNTIEYTQGVAEIKRDNFRSYGSFKESMLDYVRFLKSDYRYNQVFGNVNNPEKFTKELQQAGYATDPDYSKKINKIMNSSMFTSVLNGLKNVNNEPIT